MKQFFILFKLRDGEHGNSFSILTEELLKTLSDQIIEAKKEVPDKLYSKEELRAFVEELGGKWYATA